MPLHARSGDQSLDRFPALPSFMALAVAAFIAGCGGGNSAPDARSAAGTETESSIRESVKATGVEAPAAADPNAPGKVGNFFIRHSAPDIETADTPISLAYLNDHKAGAKGQIRNVGGKFFVGSERIRLYGLALYGGAAMPAKADAIKIAARMRKEGFNAVRFIGWDETLAKPNAWSVTHQNQGVLNEDHTLNAVAMDYFDHYVYQLQQQGIYVMLPLHANRKYREAPDCIEYCEGLDNYLPSLIQSQKTMAAAFLNHVNPYTGRAYKNDPGVVAIEINNENSLSHRWSNGTMDTYLTDATLAPKYGAPLETMWRNWVQAKYGTAAAAAAAWGTAVVALPDLKAPLKANRAAMSTKLFADWGQFTGETEGSYAKDMRDYLKNTLGVTALVFGTQSHYSTLYGRESSDISDFHSYWGDNGVSVGINNPTNGRPVFEVQNKSMLAFPEPKNIPVFGVHERKDPNKPNIISEYVSRMGNQYMAEAEPILTAYAGFQDIDAIFMTDAHQMNLYTNRDYYSGYYNVTVSAVARVAAALSFRRGDVTPGAPQIVKKTKQTYVNTVGTWKNYNLLNFQFGGNIQAPITMNMYQQLVDNVADEKVITAGGPVNGAYTTSTGEMTWKPLDRIMLNTPMTKTAIGFFKQTTLDLGSGIQVTVGNTMNNYAVVQLSSLTKGAVLPSSKMLLSLSGHFTVPGEYPRAPGSARYSWGTDTPRIEAVPSTVRITTAKNLVVTALDATGARKANVPVVRNGSNIEFVTGPTYDTGWYLLEEDGPVAQQPPPNVKPTASLSAPGTATVGTPVTVGATASDSDGTVALVEFFDGATLVATDSSAPYSVTWTPNVAGTHSLTARVTDSSGATTTSAAVNVSVSSGTNALPSATLSAPASATLGSAVTLSATASDPDGSVAKVEFLDGGTVIGTDTTAPYSVSWTPVAAGSRSLTARATDNAGATKTSTAVTVAVAAPNVAPSASLTAPGSATVGTAVTLSATATDSDGSVTKVEFLDGSTVIATDTTAPYGTAWTPSTAGTRSLTVRATDNAGASKTSNAVSVAVVLPNAKPTATVTAAGTATVGVAMTVSASASDSDGSVAKVEFMENGTVVATDTSAPYSSSWTPSVLGTRSLTVRATDNDGATTTSAAVNVQVTAAPLPTFGGLLANYYANKDLAGSPAITRVEPLSFVWSSATGVTSPGAGLGSNDWSARWSGTVKLPSSGTYTFQVVADDGVRVRINGQLVVNKWSNGGNAYYQVAPITGAAGSSVEIEVEHFDGSGDSTVKLRWKTSTTAKYWATVPASQLFPN
jgi:hypothetical protein